jgi:protease PrsW
MDRAAHSAPVRPTPRVAGVLGSLRLPAFWLLVTLLLTGAAQVGVMIGQAFALYPVATTVDVVLFGLYAVPFLIFVDRLDYLEREPPLLLATAFGWGGLVATSVAIPGNAALDSLLAKLGSPGLAATWGPALTGPTIEEPVKLLGVVMIALIARAQINSVVDGFVYGALAGLGFQVVENVLYAANEVAYAGQGDRVWPVLAVFVTRGFLAGPWSHTLFTALAGAGVGYAVVRRDRDRASRYGAALLCLAGAWLAHFLWNSPVLADGFGLGVPGQLFALLVKGTPALVMVLALVRAARHREADYYARVLSRAADPRLVTPDEIESLRSPAGRSAARRDGYARAGWRGARAVRRLQRAQAQLAVELSRSDGPGDRPGTEPGDVPGSVARSRDDVLQARRRLRALPGRVRPAGTVVWLLGFAAALLALGLGLLLRALG